MKISLTWLVLLFLIGVGGTSAPAQEPKHATRFTEHRFLPGYAFRKMAHPEFFQGNTKAKKYFEGWYFKMASANDSSIINVIPGIAISRDGKEQNAFIQVIDGKTAETAYYSFPVEEFSFSRKEFAIRIGQNYFSNDKLVLNIHTDSSSIAGEIRFSEKGALPARCLLNAGIMGWYRFVPFMQCYHGVVSLTHRLEGSLVKNGRNFNFDQGKGYIEKDWGNSMPSAWIWMQSNSFADSNSSFMLSVAHIPWLGKSFTGFLGFLYYNNKIHRFGTYTRARLSVQSATPDTLKISIRDRKNTYKIVTVNSHAGLLKAPVHGSMDRRIPESSDARLCLTVSDRKGKVIYADSTSCAGLEIVGDQKLLLRKPK